MSEGNVINGLAPLANVARLWKLIDLCQNRAHGLPGMGCFHGRAGLGKTSAAIFATNTFNACHVVALPIGGVIGLLGTIAIELGVAKPQRTTHGLFGQVVQEIAKTRRPLIIDEADHVQSDKTIEIIRMIHDMSQVPVILIGEETLPQSLQRWERVHSRMLSWVGAETATMEDVDHLAKIYCAGVTLAADLRRALLDASRGSLRNVSTNLADVREFAAARGLATISLSSWGGKSFHTGEAPAARHISAATRRGAAA